MMSGYYCTIFQLYGGDIQILLKYYKNMTQATQKCTVFNFLLIMAGRCQLFSNCLGKVSVHQPVRHLASIFSGHEYNGVSRLF